MFATMVERDRGTHGNGVVEMAWEQAFVSTSPQLPTGTVTFLLTDIEGSTVHWATEPDAMADAVARHYEILDRVVAAHGGVRPIEQGEGDSVVAAFARTSDAVAAALEAQRRLRTERWPTSTPLSVRIAVHAGDARLRDEGNYAGPAIIRTARLRAIAHGGQIVASSAVRDIVVDDLPDGVTLVDLGMHRLKDLSRPERVWQVVHPELQTDFPSLRSLDAVPNNLPVSLSSFIGRFDAIDTVTKLVLDNRLVTLTGTGGAGKTRLAQQVAAEVAEVFPDGVWWVELSAVEDPLLIASAVSRAVRLPEDARDRLGGLIRRLASKRMLVVLDNCEHLLDAAAETAASVLMTCPDVSILATSRASLNVPGELSWRVPPLAMPRGGDGERRVEDVARFDAVRLFTDRATRARADFRLTDDNARDVAEICARLDGIPLAIELAAARCRVLTPSQILAGLSDAMGLLTAAQRGVLPRHQTIDASIRWSHSLLTDDERTLLRRLAVFASAFTFEAARAVGADDHLAETSVLAVLEALVDQSLVQMDDLGAVARFHMLETVRQFARRELEDAGETDAVAARHATYFAARARTLWPLFEPNMYELLDQADAEFADLALMLAYLEEHGSAEEHAEVAMACLPAMAVRHVIEAAVLGNRAAARVDERSVLGGRLHLRLILVEPTNPEHVALGVAAAEATGDPDLLVTANYMAAWRTSQSEPTREVASRLREARRALADIGENHFSRTFWIPVGVDRSVGRIAEATADWQRAVDETICKRCNVMVWGEGALLALARGDLTAAEDALERAQAFGVEVRDAGFLSFVRLVESEVATYAGKAWPAAEVESDLANGLAIGHPMIVGYTAEARAVGLLADGAAKEADADLVTAIEHLVGGWPQPAAARVRRAAAHHALGDHDEAARLLQEVRTHAAQWDAGPWLLSQIDHRGAALALDAGDIGAADDLVHRALSDAWLGPCPPLVVAALELLTSVAVARESHVEAVRLLGAASHQRELIGFRFEAEPERSRLARDVAVARDALGDGFDAAFAEGAALTLDEAVAYARRARGERKRPSHGWDGLTPTERQVAELAVGGLTNAQIADRLFIGRETVKTHLSNVYAKVGVANRTQLVADAARRDITT